MQDETKPAVVIDNGSEDIKAGLAGDDAPSSCFPNVVGRPRNSIFQSDNAIFVGEKAQAKKEILILTHPVENGIIINWDDMERVWNHVFFKELRVSPRDHPVLLTQTPMNSKFNKERMTQIMFETFNVPSFYVSIAAVLSLYGSGRIYGVVVDSGEGVTHCVPIYDGYQIPEAISKMDLAGGACTGYMATLLNELGYSFYTPSQKEITKDIKEKLCYIAQDPKEEDKKYQESSASSRPYKLPDGNILIKTERFRCPEILFSPEMVGLEVAGIHLLVTYSIMRSDFDFRKDLYGNIVLSGGTTLFPGLPERLNQEIAILAPQSMKIKVVATPERRYTSWIGGSILSDLSTFQSLLITRSEYDESGPSIVLRKCY